MPKFFSFTMVAEYDGSAERRDVLADVLDTFAEFAMLSGTDFGFDPMVSASLDAPDPVDAD